MYLGTGQVIRDLRWHMDLASSSCRRGVSYLRYLSRRYVEGRKVLATCHIAFWGRVTRSDVLSSLDSGETIEQISRYHSEVSRDVAVTRWAPTGMPGGNHPPYFHSCRSATGNAYSVRATTAPQTFLLPQMATRRRTAQSTVYEKIRNRRLITLYRYPPTTLHGRNIDIKCRSNSSESPKPMVNTL